jgi:hypothetical protein
MDESLIDKPDAGGRQTKMKGVEASLSKRVLAQEAWCHLGRTTLIKFSIISPGEWTDSPRMPHLTETHDKPHPERVRSHLDLPGDRVTRSRQR